MKYIGLFDEKEDIVTKEKLDAVEAAIPTKTSQLDNDSGFITSAPVTSVNTKTGAVTLSASDVGAQPTITVNGIIKGDGAGNLSAQDTVAAELVDLPTVPTKVSELTNDSGYITAAQAPVQSVNNKTGAVQLNASDVSAIPSTLTGTAGQVLTKTADGQEWKDAASPKAIKITLSVAEWNSTAKTQSVTVPGVSADATKQEIRVIPVNAALDSPYIAAGVQCVAQAANSLTFACETVPTEAIEVYVVIQGVDYSA